MQRLLSLFGRGTPADQMDVAEFAAAIIKNNPVAVFSKSGCPFCSSAISALKNAKVKNMHIENISGHPQMGEIQAQLQKVTGGRTVPRVFVGGEFVGGCDETLSALRKETFLIKLKEAGAF